MTDEETKTQQETGMQTGIGADSTTAKAESGVDDGAPKKKAATRKTKGKEKMFALITAFPLVHPRTKTRFTQNTNVLHEEDDWVKAQIRANLMIEVK